MIEFRNKKTGEIQSADKRISQMYEDVYCSNLDPILRQQYFWTVEELAKEYGINLPIINPVE